MFTYDEAYKIAAKLKDPIDCGTEYQKGWLFGCKDDENWTGGAGHTPVIVLKEDGRTVNAPYFYMMIGAGELLREFDIDPDGNII